LFLSDGRSLGLFSALAASSNSAVNRALRNKAAQRPVASTLSYVQTIRLVFFK
jgi:hypothetical protein